MLRVSRERGFVLLTFPISLTQREQRIKDSIYCIHFSNTRPGNTIKLTPGFIIRGAEANLRASATFEIDSCGVKFLAQNLEFFFGDGLCGSQRSCDFQIPACVFFGLLGRFTWM